MSQQEVEVILARHLAEYLATPIFIVNPRGDLIFYNEPAEAILGKTYGETGEMPVEEWSSIFHPMDSEGKPLPPEELPLVIALTEHRLAHKIFSIRGLDGGLRQIEVVAFPLISLGHRFLGGVAIFWEITQ